MMKQKQLVDLDNAASLYERVAASRVFFRALLVSALGSWLVAGAGDEYKFYSAAGAIALGATLWPWRWLSVLVLVVFVLGPLPAVIRRLKGLVDVIGWDVRFTLIFVISAVIFVAVVINSQIGLYRLARSSRESMKLVRERMSIQSIIGAPAAINALDRGRPGIFALFFCSSLLVAASISTATNLTVTSHKAIGAEHVVKGNCYKKILDIVKENPLGAAASMEKMLEICSEKGRYKFYWIVTGALALPLVLLLFGLRLNAVARRRFVMSAGQLMKSDDRPPILFLRDFSDDRVKLEGPGKSRLRRILWWGRRYSSLDEMLVLETSVFGPIVAIGRPGERVRSFGICRTFAKDGAWKDEVTALAERASAIILVGGKGEGLRWELALVSSDRYRHKTLILLPPVAASSLENGELLHAIRAHSGQLFQPDASCGGRPVLGMCRIGGGPACAVSTQFSSVAYLLAIRWFFDALSQVDARSA